MFNKFLNKLRTPENSTLVEAIKKGYNTIMEAQQEFDHKCTGNKKCKICGEGHNCFLFMDNKYVCKKCGGQVYVAGYKVDKGKGKLGLGDRLVPKWRPNDAEGRETFKYIDDNVADNMAQTNKNLNKDDRAYLTILIDKGMDPGEVKKEVDNIIQERKRLSEINKTYFSGTYKPRKEDYQTMYKVKDGPKKGSKKKAWDAMMDLEKEGKHPWGAENADWRNRPDEPAIPPDVQIEYDRLMANHQKRSKITTEYYRDTSGKNKVWGLDHPRHRRDTN